MVRFARLPHTAAALFVILACSPAARAQNAEPSLALAVDVAATQNATAQSTVAPPVRAGDPRPAELVPLYVSFVTLQVLDIHSTQSALSRGGVEANPAVKAVAGNTVGMTAVKAAGTAGIIFASEKLRTKNKAAAIGLMIASNAAMTWVVQHNYRIAR
jgi:hypothetical protein